RGMVFDSSVIMAEAAAQGAGVALLPVAMFTRELQQGGLVQPFAIETAVGSYWLTSLRSKRLTGVCRHSRPGCSRMRATVSSSLSIFLYRKVSASTRANNCSRPRGRPQVRCFSETSVSENKRVSVAVAVELRAGRRHIVVLAGPCEGRGRQEGEESEGSDQGLHDTSPCLGRSSSQLSFSDALVRR